MHMECSIQLSSVVPDKVEVSHVSFCALLFSGVFHWDQLAGAVVLQARVAEGAYDRLPDLRLMDCESSTSGMRLTVHRTDGGQAV